MSHTPVQPETAEPLRYALNFPAPHAHGVEIEVSIPTGGQPQVELMMAVWTPGSYLVREFSRHVEGVTALGASGATLAVERTAKNRWRVTTVGAPRITVTYRVYAREMSVRTNWVEAGFALLNGAPTFITLADSVARPHEVTLALPAGWASCFTALELVPGESHTYRAPDFDALVDSPFVAGTPEVLEFQVDGKLHFLVTEGGGGVFDGSAAVRDLERVVREHRRMWGFLPYEQYRFFNLITEGRGGLEHRDSCTIMASRWATRSRKAYLSWLELASHEFFHAWNGKRLRPAELGPFDYERENYTRSLWAVEGITDYYGDLAVHRAGLSNQEEYLASLSNQIEVLQTTPGRLAQPADRASLETWIRFYHPDENSPNVSISYYTKGYVLAFLLDSRVRRETKGAASLDDVMRTAYGAYSGRRGYTVDEFQAVAEQVAGTSLADFWSAGVTGVGELDYSGALATLGLRFRRADPAPPDPLVGGYLGALTREDVGRLVVSGIPRDTPAHDGGLNVEDEILAIDEFRVLADGLPDRLARYRPGDIVSVLVSRRERLQRLAMTLGAAPVSQWRLEPDPKADDESALERERWLRGQTVVAFSPGG
jgi:predicted metalloprotease with PDZ domain